MSCGWKLSVLIQAVGSKRHTVSGGGGGKAAS